MKGDERNSEPWSCFGAHFLFLLRHNFLEPNLGQRFFLFLMLGVCIEKKAKHKIALKKMKGILVKIDLKVFKLSLCVVVFFPH